MLDVIGTRSGIISESRKMRDQLRFTLAQTLQHIVRQIALMGTTASLIADPREGTTSLVTFIVSKKMFAPLFGS